MRLTALRPENPVAMMAAYGALRLLPGAQIRWEAEHPELRWDGDIVRTLADRLPERIQAPEVTLLNDPRDKNIGGIAGFRRLAEQIPHEWLSAYAAESSEGIVATDLLLLGGRHQFVTLAREILRALAGNDVAAKIEEALIGPWTYQDSALAWGWDAAVRLDASALPLEVTSAHKAGVLGAYWLAWESLPMWQLIGSHTVGMHREHRQWHWTYPTCAEWLSWPGLRALVVGLARMSDQELQSLGVRTWVAPVLATSQFGKELGLARTRIIGQKQAGSRKIQA
jgi:hypothetical protein